MSEVRIGDVVVANERPLTLFAGLNVLESRDLALRVAEALVAACEPLGLPLVFKGSYDKANRSSPDSHRGPGLDAGLEILAAVRDAHGLAVMTDVHEPAQAAPVAEVAEVLQLPAFLCRQTDLVSAIAETGAVINIKKAQFMAPEDMAHTLAKCQRAGNARVMLCERGSCFGYHNLVVDMLGLDQLKAHGCPVLLDASHALQLPGALGAVTGGRRAGLPGLARAGVAHGLAGLFFETHPEPERALCDGPCAWPLDQLRPLLDQIVALDALVKGFEPLRPD